MLLAAAIGAPAAGQKESREGGEGRDARAAPVPRAVACRAAASRWELGSEGRVGVVLMDVMKCRVAMAKGGRSLEGESGRSGETLSAKTRNSETLPPKI